MKKGTRRILSIVAGILVLGLITAHACRNIDPKAVVAMATADEEVLLPHEAYEVFHPQDGLTFGVYDGAKSQKDGNVRIWYYQAWTTPSGVDTRVEWEMRHSKLVKATDVAYRPGIKTPDYNWDTGRIILPQK